MSSDSPTLRVRLLIHRGFWVFRVSISSWLGGVQFVSECLPCLQSLHSRYPGLLALRRLLAIAFEDCASEPEERRGCCSRVVKQRISLDPKRVKVWHLRKHTRECIYVAVLFN